MYSNRPARTHGFNAKIGFEKYAPSPEISAKMCQNLQVWFRRLIFDTILGLGAYISKPIFALRPWVRVGRFEYHELYNPNNFFFTYKGVRVIFVGNFRHFLVMSWDSVHIFQTQYCIETKSPSRLI